MLYTALCAMLAQTHAGQVDLETEKNEQGDRTRALDQEQAGLLRGVLKDPQENPAVPYCHTPAPRIRSSGYHCPPRQGIEQKIGEV